MARFRTQNAFTIVELLVVITIVAVLVALMLPTVSKSKILANAVKCGAVQKSLFVALDAYAVANGEYPTNYNRNVGISQNWGDECAGAMSGAPPTSQTIGGVTVTPLITPSPYGGGNMSVLERLFYAGVIPGYGSGTTGIWMKSAAVNCAGAIPNGWVPRPIGNGNNKIFVYNGPSSSAGSIGNNSNASGMSIIGRHYVWRASTSSYIGTGGEPWGVSYKRPTTRNQPSDVGFLGCPSFVLTSTTELIEPHGNGDSAPGASQFDFPSVAGYDAFSFARNYTFADGHTRYIIRESRMAWVP